MVVVAAGIRPNIELASEPGCTVERAIVVDDQMRTRRRRRLRGRRVRAAPRRGLRPGRAAVGAGRGARRPRSPGPNPTAAYHGSRTATKLKVAGVDVAVDGHQGAGARRRRVRGRSPSRSTGVYKTRRHPRRQADRRDAARRHPQGRLPDAGVRPRPAAARGAGPADVRPRRRRRRRSAPPSWPTTRRSATATASARRRSLRRRRRRLQNGRWRDGRDPGRQGLRFLQDAWSRRSSSGPPAASVEEDPSANWYVPGVPMDKPELMAAIRELQLMQRVRRCSPRSPGGDGGREVARWAWPRCCR